MEGAQNRVASEGGMKGHLSRFKIPVFLRLGSLGKAADMFSNLTGKLENHATSQNIFLA